MTATAQTQESRDETRGRAFSERGPVARSYRKFLGRSMLLMFTLIIISTLLLPMLYMVTTAFQQPGQSATPGAPVWRPWCQCEAPAIVVGLPGMQRVAAWRVPWNGSRLESGLWPSR